MITDTHAHLNDERLMPQADEIVGRLGEYGVGRLICASYDRRSSEDAVMLADKYKNVYAAVAFHPHEAKNYTPDDGRFFSAATKNPKVVAIGETGLDYYYEHSPREAQKHVFREHLVLADDLKLPVIIHIRDAYDDAIELLENNRSLLNSGVLIHSFSGDTETMKRLDLLGCYYAFGGTITFKNNKKGAEALSAADRSKILIETDCPYLTPEPHRGKLNFPYYVKYVAEKCAEILGMEYGEFCAVTEENTKRLFFKIG
jgi:TatD DNase family protein